VQRISEMPRLLSVGSKP